MNTIKEAIPTEYKGVKFRSKSEAILARTFDLIGWLWRYEPYQWQTKDGWVPDFWVVSKSANGGIFSFLLEYKPSKPTDTYIKQLAIRCLEKSEALCGHSEIILYGSPFDESQPRGVLLLEDGVFGPSSYVDNILRSVEWKWQEAKTYRFDLAQGASEAPPPYIPPIVRQEPPPPPASLPAAKPGEDVPIKNDTVWPRICEIVAERRRLIAAWAECGVITNISDGTMTVVFSTENSFAGMFLMHSHMDFLSLIASEVLGRPMRVELYQSK